MSDKFQRDLENNKKFRDIYIHTAAEPWLPFCPGIDFKLLRTTQETGAWTALFKCAVGSKFDRHEHLGSGEYVMLFREDGDSRWRTKWRNHGACWRLRVRAEWRDPRSH